MSSRTTAICLAMLALSAQGCVEVVIVKRDSGLAQDAGQDGAVSDAGSAEDGEVEVDGSVESDAGSGDGGEGEDAIVTGTPEGEWRDVSANLAGMSAECGTVTTIAASPNENRLLVGLSARGVFSSTDGGGSWSRM